MEGDRPRLYEVRALELKDVETYIKFKRTNSIRDHLKAFLDD